MWQVDCPLIPGIMEVVLLMSWEGEPRWEGRCLGKKLGSASTHCAVAVNMTVAADMAGKQGEKGVSARVSTSSAHTTPPGTPALD